MTYQEYKVVQSKEIVWCNGDDRYILIMRENDEIVGLNFMQGDEFEVFVEAYDEIDHDLTNFFKAIEPYLVHENQLDRINAAMWAWIDIKEPK